MKIIDIPLQKQHSQKDSLSLRFIIYILFSLLASTILTRETLSAQTANDDHVSTHIDNPITINPTDNDSGCGSYNVAITAAPQNGTTSTIATNGSFTYTPNSGFTGRDSLQYSITCNGSSYFAWIYIVISLFPDNVTIINCTTTPPSNIWSCSLFNQSAASYTNDVSNFTGDIDNDGTVEVLAVANQGFTYSNFYFLNPNIAGMPVKYSFTVCNGSHISHDNSISFADVDRDGYAEIFYTAFNGNLYCLGFDTINHNYFTTPRWTNIYNSYNNFYKNPPPMFADFNGDGTPEVMVYDRIYNAVTGQLLVNGNFASNGWNFGCGALHYSNENETAPSVMAIGDLDNDGYPEIAAGNMAYKVSIINPTGTSGNSISLYRQSDTRQDVGDGATALADIDLDGNLDVIVSRRKSATLAAPFVQTYEATLFVWAPQTGNIINNNIIANISCHNQGKAGPSIPLISDMDGDGYPEIGLSARNIVNTYKYYPTLDSLGIMWSISTTDNSASTGLTLFDFNLDGSAELIYRDQTTLRIFNGSNGSILTTFNNSSLTANEYPVIADVNNDGAAEILITGENRVCIFSSNPPGQWAPARHVWNQYAYNVVNINNDLTVPQYQFNPSTPLVDPNTPTVVRRPFNNFLQQATSIDQYGIPFFTLPDAAVIEDSTIVYNSCDSMRISLYYKNEGDNVLSAPYKITVYKDTYRGPVIRTATVTSNLYPDSSSMISFSFNSADLLPFQPITDFVFALNDGGTGIAQNGNQQTECDTTDNILTLNYEDNNEYIEIQISDDICQGEPYTENGFDIPADSTQVAGTIIHRQLIIVTIGGCDSIVTLSLSVNENYYTRIDAEICQGDTYSQNGFNLSETGNDTLFFQTVKGCDSIIVLSLTVNDTVPITYLQAEICLGETYSENGFNVSTLGIHQLSLLTSHGCDSIVTLSLSVNDPYYTRIDAEICQGDTYSQNGFNLSETANDTLFFQTVKGCDSIIVLSLTVNDTVSTTYLQAEICLGETYSENGFNVSTPGIHQLSLLTSLGCDSIIELELTVYPLYNIEITKEACNYYRWNDETYYDSGDYTQSFTSAQGCDSTVTLHLSIIDANIEIIPLTEDFCEEYFSVLTANSTIDDILWSTGEISDTIIVRYPGNYSVSISLANCNAEDAITIPPCDFNLYLPNTITPSNHDGLNDYFMLPLNETPQISEAEIEIYDRWGKMVFISKDIYFKWDGNVNGIILSNTVFNYRLLVKTQMRKPMMFTGSITVL